MASPAGTRCRGSICFRGSEYVRGVIAFVVAQRRREIAIRLTLGATPGQARAFVLLGAVRWVALSAICARWWKSLLFGVSALDGGVIIAAILVLTAISLLAALPPAMRANAHRTRRGDAV
jgi:ABC-type iron transport system FetAB permease component